MRCMGFVRPILVVRAHERGVTSLRSRRSVRLWRTGFRNQERIVVHADRLRAEGAVAPLGARARRGNARDQPPHRSCRCEPRIAEPPAPSQRPARLVRPHSGRKACRPGSSGPDVPRSCEHDAPPARPLRLAAGSGATSEDGYGDSGPEYSRARPGCSRAPADVTGVVNFG